ncbi:MAG TPA: FGGY-family carbohydrate kinase, partial [Stackebrandtia sp.]|uniref:FGGY-family carbohydrate kinase n=1 Tax=Stackebrandtia sp. TaxID=2023065 RepID=UPI002D2302F4
WKLGGATDPAAATTDRSDASVTGYWSPADGRYRHDLLELALGRAAALPRVADPHAIVGRTPAGAVLSAGAGDNAAAALGLGASEGDVVVSVGTSGTAFAPGPTPPSDVGGDVAGFADAAGGFLPLVCTLNAARVLDTTAALLGVAASGFDDLALAANPGSGGLSLLPYFDGERTPDRPRAHGVLNGLSTTSLTRENLARAAVEGVLCGLADGIDRLRDQGVDPRRVLLIGGGAASQAVRRIACEILGTPVTVPAPGEYVALGAARQAAWALSGAEHPPRWPAPESHEYAAAPRTEARQRYAELRRETAAWEGHS